MKKICRFVLFAVALCFITGCETTATGKVDAGAKISAADTNEVSMGTCKMPPVDPVVIFKMFKGTPYRNDGAVTVDGKYTLFADRTAEFDTPGFNCSGFTVAAARYLLSRQFNLDDVIKDINGDSGPDAEAGHDWDFGYDLVLNLTAGRDRRVMLPYGQKACIADSNGASLRGFALHDKVGWKDVLSQMKEGMVYFFSLSKPVHFKNYKLIHHHVGIMAKSKDGHIYLAHATTKSGVNIVDMSLEDGLDSFLDVRPENNFGDRMILIVETPAVIK